MADDQATQLTGLVLPCGQCPTIGPETSKRLTPDIMLYFHSVRTFRPHAPHKKGGSYRFVRTVNGQIVAGLQVMSQTGAGGTVANIYCRPEHRRRGHVTVLFNAAKTCLGELQISSDQSPDGRLWANSHVLKHGAESQDGLECGGAHNETDEIRPPTPL